MSLKMSVVCLLEAVNLSPGLFCWSSTVVQSGLGINSNLGPVVSGGE